MTFNNGKRKVKTPETIEAACVMRPLLLPNNRDWLGAFTGVLLQLTYAYNWQQVSETDLTPEEAAAYSQHIIDEYFNQQGGCDMGCCKPPLTRVTNEWIVQTSIDNGVTWVDTPSADPRQISVQFPPLGGEDGDGKRCKAAENIVAILESNIDDFVEMLNTFTAIAAFIVAIGGIIAIVLSAGTLSAAVASLGAALWALGASLLDAAFTEEVYNNLKCFLYCQMSEEGQLTQAGMNTALADFQSEYPNTPQSDIVALLFQNYGIVGLNNLATLQSSGDGDSCEECDCGEAIESCYYINFTIENDPDWENVSGFGRGAYSPSYGWVGTSGTGPSEKIAIRYTLPSEHLITELYMGANAAGTIRFFIDDVLIDEVGGAGFYAPYFIYPNISGTEIKLELEGVGGAYLAIGESTIRVSGSPIDFDPYNCED